jgi:streptogramin lyase
MPQSDSERTYQIFKVRDIAARHDVSERTVRLWISWGLPVVRLSSRTVRIDERDLDVWLRAGGAVRRQPTEIDGAR